MGIHKGGRPRRLTEHLTVYVNRDTKEAIIQHRRKGEVENDVVQRAMRELRLSSAKDKRLYGMEEQMPSVKSNFKFLVYKHPEPAKNDAMLRKVLTKVPNKFIK